MLIYVGYKMYNNFSYILSYNYITQSYRNAKLNNYSKSSISSTYINFGRPAVFLDGIEYRLAKVKFYHLFQLFY